MLNNLCYDMCAYAMVNKLLVLGGNGQIFVCKRNVLQSLILETKLLKLKLSWTRDGQFSNDKKYFIINKEKINYFDVINILNKSSNLFFPLK